MILKQSVCDLIKEPKIWGSQNGKFQVFGWDICAKKCQFGGYGAFRSSFPLHHHYWHWKLKILDWEINIQGFGTIHFSSRDPKFGDLHHIYGLQNPNFWGQRYEGSEPIFQGVHIMKHIFYCWGNCCCMSLSFKAQVLVWCIESEGSLSSKSSNSIVSLEMSST